MFDSIEKFLGNLVQGTDAPELDEEQLRVAGAALLVHCANADGKRTSEEDAKLRQILASWFELTSADVDEVIAVAERQERDAVDLHRFTRVLHAQLDRDARRAMVRRLWDIAAADGRIDQDERHLVSRIAGLLDVELRDTVAARRAAERDA